MSYQEKGISEEKIRILHVDDDSSILVTSKQILSIINPVFEVDSANSVDEAWCKLGQRKYDVVVSDYEMPKKSGLDLLVELRNNKNSTPLIIFTGRGREEVAIKALNLGAAGYYGKHGNPETVFGELSHGIKAVIDFRRAQKALALSEAKFTRAFQNGPVAITITRVSDGQVVEANNSIQTVLGYTPEELIGKSTLELGIWRNPQDRTETMAKLAQKGSISDEELVINKKDGSIITVLLCASLIELQNETCLIASFTDVTALKKTGDELREKELRYRLLADNARDVIWTMDLEGHFTYVSPSVHKLRGYTPEEVIKQPITEALTPESASLILEALQSSLKEYFETGKIPKPNTFRLQQPCKDGSNVWTEVNYSVITDNEGKPQSILGVSRDITERMKAEELVKRSNQTIDSIINSTTDLVFALDSNWNFIYANKQTAKLVGLEPAGLVGKNGWEIFPGAIGTNLEKGLREAMDERVPKRVVFENPKAGLVWENNIFPIDNGLTVFVKDITERKIAEAQLEERYQAIARVAESINSGLVIIGKDYRVIWANDRLQRVGLKPNNICYHVFGRTSPCPDCGVKKVFEENVSLDVRDYKSLKFGSKSWVELRVTPLKGKDGHIIAALELAIPIAERKKAEEALKESHSQLQVANEKLKVVGSLTRHDVRNKLSIVNTNLYLLKKQVKDNPLALKYIEAIELATKQSDKIFEFTSQYEKIGLERITDIDVGETFNQALKNTPEAAKISVTNNAIGLTVRADSLLQQLFYNLVDNSLRHGEHVTKISLSYEDSTDCIRLVYEDNGVGVPDANKKRIFFGGFTTGHGSGLGLMIVKKMIETYGWKIKEDGEEGKGARFTIAIPKVSS